MKKPLLYATLVALLGFWACQKDSLTNAVESDLNLAISERGDSTQVDSCGGHGHHPHDSTWVHIPHDSTWIGGGHHGHDSIPFPPHDSTWTGGGHHGGSHPGHDSIPQPPHDSTGHPGGGHGGGHGGGGHHGGGH